MSRTVLSQSGFTPQVARIVSQADRDIANGYLESALDLTLLAQSLAPECAALHLRQAELLTATGRPTRALEVVQSLRRLFADQGAVEFENEIERLTAQLQPTSENLVRLAERLLGSNQLADAGHYALVAINALVEEGDVARAAALAQRWHDRMPQDPDALFILVRELLRSKQIEEARVRAENGSRALAGTAPFEAGRLATLCLSGSSEQWPLISVLSRQMKSGHLDGDAFASLIQQVVSIFPSSGDLRVHYGLTQLAANKTSEALATLQSAEPSTPLANLLAAIGTTRAAMDSGDDQATSEGISRVHALLSHPDIRRAAQLPGVIPTKDETDELSREAASLLLRSGRADHAVRVIGRLLTESPNDPVLLQEYASALSHTGNGYEAVAELRSLLERQLQTQNRTGATQTMRSILQITPGDDDIREKLTTSLTGLGRLDEAANELMVHAELLIEKARDDEALIQLQRAAQIAETLNDHTLFERVYRMMLELRPDDVAVRYAAVTAFVKQNRLRDAIEQLHAVVRVALMGKDLREASAALQQIITLSPRNVEAHYALARIQTSIENYSEACRIYQRLMSLQPDNQVWKEKLSAIVTLARSRR